MPRLSCNDFSQQWMLCGFVMSWGSQGLMDSLWPQFFVGNERVRHWHGPCASRSRPWFWMRFMEKRENKGWNIFEGAWILAVGLRISWYLLRGLDARERWVSTAWDQGKFGLDIKPISLYILSLYWNNIVPNLGRGVSICLERNNEV